MLTQNVNPAKSNTTTYLYNLTPLRGIAALLTVIFHLDLLLGMGGNLLVKFEDSLLISKLYLMVDFFFMMSGFIMFFVYREWFKNSVRGASLKQFTIARFARVYPLHFFALLYLIVLRIWFVHSGAPDDPFSASSDTLASIPTNLLLIQSMNIHNWFSWNNAAWSISTEWWMYILFPFLVKPLLNLKTPGIIVTILVCIAGYLAIMFYIQQFVTVPPALSFIQPPKPLPTINVAYQFGFLRCLFGFILGMVVYLAYKAGFAKNVFGRSSTFLLLCAGMFTCLHFGVWDVLSVSFFPLIILSAAYGSISMNRFLGTKAMQRIGDWSFSIYMVHQPILYTTLSVVAYANPAKPGTVPTPPTMLTGWLICIAFIIFTLLIASLTFRFIEVPARMWINHKFSPNHNLPHVKPVS